MHACPSPSLSLSLSSARPTRAQAGWCFPILVATVLTLLAVLVPARPARADPGDGAGPDVRRELVGLLGQRAAADPGRCLGMEYVGPDPDLGALAGDVLEAFHSGGATAARQAADANPGLRARLAADLARKVAALESYARRKEVMAGTAAWTVCKLSGYRALLAAVAPEGGTGSPRPSPVVALLTVSPWGVLVEEGDSGPYFPVGVRASLDVYPARPLLLAVDGWFGAGGRADGEAGPALALGEVRAMVGGGGLWRRPFVYDHVIGQRVGGRSWVSLAPLLTSDQVVAFHGVGGVAIARLPGGGSAAYGLGGARLTVDRRVPWVLLRDGDRVPPLAGVGLSLEGGVLATVDRQGSPALGGFGGLYTWLGFLEGSVTVEAAAGDLRIGFSLAVGAHGRLEARGRGTMLFEADEWDDLLARSRAPSR